MKGSRLRLIGYVRVSRIAGREGESFISPDVQRERIEHAAAAKGHTVVSWEEDLDQPGSKASRPGFQNALGAVEAGEADGIIVAKLDRFARSLRDALDAIERVENAGGKFLSVADDFDTSTPVGKAVVRILLVLAELELDRIRESWSVASARAIRRGVHICRVPPVGYRRRADSRLEPDPTAAPVVRELFRRRAAGESWESLCNFLDERLPRENGGSWTRQTVTSVIGRRTYLGEAFAGDIINRTAHEPIVTPAEWEAAQTGTRLAHGRSDGPLLAGILRCAGCGYVMTRAADGARGYENYRCRVRHSAGCCPEPARISIARADAYVESVFLAWIEQERLRPVHISSAQDEVEAAQRLIEAAHAELAAYRDETIIAAIGREAYVDGLAKRRRRLEEASGRLADARQRSATPLLQALELVDMWPALSVAERRSLLAATIDAAFVRRAGRPGKGSPASGRVHILWRGEGAPDLPGRGASFLRPFAFPQGDDAVRKPRTHDREKRPLELGTRE